MSQRIKGQEVSLVLTKDGQSTPGIDAIQNIEFTFQQDLLSEGYLGETTERKDSVFKGIQGKCEYHFGDQAALQLLFAITDKAKRRTPGVRFNLKATLAMPNGQRPKVLFPDVEFGELPVNFGSRTDYGSVSLNFGCSDAKLITT